MGSLSSINLNSLLSAFGSSSTGINVPAAVAQAMAALSGPEQQWQAEQVTLQSQTNDINSILKDISGLTDALSALGDPAGAITSMATTSSNSGIATASAAAGTVAGNHVVVVNNLATTASWYSNSVASSSTALAAGGFDLQVGSGAPTHVTIGSGVNTLDQLVTYINGLNQGVTASVVNDSTGSRLAIVSTASGSAANFTISNPSGLTFTQGVAGNDASLTVDGIPIQSASNTVTGAVAGLTFNLQGAAPGTQVNIGVAPDATQISKAVSNFVDAYNTAIKDVNSVYAVDGNNKQGSLASDSTLRILQDDLLSAANYTAGSGAITSLAGLGVTMNNDGTLSVDNSALTNAVQNNFADVQAFMQGAASNGFAATLKAQLNTLSDPTTGAFTVDLQSIKNQNTDLQNNIDNFQAYLNTQQTLLTAQYNQADILLQELPNQLAQINAQLGLNTNNKQGG